MKVLVFHLFKDNKQYSFYVKDRKNITDAIAKKVIDSVSDTFKVEYQYDNINYVKSMMYACDMSANKIDGDIMWKDNYSSNFTNPNNTIEVV